MAARGETQANVEVSTLVVPAWRLRWRAPELALVLGERALALASARHDEADRLRAESLVVFAGNRVGRGVRIADRAIDALKAAEAAGEHETAWLLRVELAACARSVGAPLTGFAAVTPVLEAQDVPAELRASALVQASECLVTVGRGDEPTLALAEADQLYVADTTLDEDTRLLLRGLIRAVQAAQHRRWGDIAAAIGAAREGLDLLSRFADPSADSGQGMGRLTLELVLALMDANRLLDASEVGTPMLDRPVRAPSASTTGWLRLALATRVHLPAGRVALAREMLREAAASAERHQLDTLLAESLLALAHVHEVSGELADALTNLRSAHAAERRRARAVYAVRARLAAEFSGVHRQPADLHQQLASLLRPVEGMQIVTDGVLSAALKQQLRTWRPVQVRKGDGLKVKRVRRAAEDMTVEGLSAARQHAAERWRTVQPFGEPDEKTPEPLEPPPPAVPSSDRTVPASGLIASAGAMVSGRRRAARVAAGEIDEDQPTSTPADPPSAPEPEVLSPEQERKRKVEAQLMELQREARRQIEAERQARAEQRAQAEREAAEEAARQAAARQEAERQEAARQAAEREAAAREAAAREAMAREAAAREALEREAAAREEASRREAAARDEASRAQPESVLDMLKALGLRAGGRRRAPDAETSSDAPSWRVEPPSRLRQDEPAPQSYFSGQDHPDAPNYFADPSSPDAPSRSGLAAAFSRPPAAPDFGPHLDDPAPAYPLHTPAAGFPAAPADERKLPERDYTSLDLAAQQWSTASIPTPEPEPSPSPEREPEPKPLPPIPDPIPSVPTPDEIPHPAEPDLLSTSFLSSADVEPEDVPTTPVQLDHLGTGFNQPTFGTQTSFGTQTFGTQSFGTQPTFGTQTGFGTQPDPSPAADPDSTRPPEPETRPDPAGWANFDMGPDFDVDPIVRMSTPPPAEDLDQPTPASDPDSTPQYDFFATEPTQEEEALAVAEPAPAPLTDYEAAGIVSPSEPKDEPGTRSGRPSSRRKPSDLSLADLLAEALVAYETGRRSDEEQLDATVLAVPDWSATDTEQPPPARAAEDQSSADALFQPGQPFGAQPSSDADSFGSPQRPDADTRIEPGQPFGVASADLAGEGRTSTDALFDPSQSFGPSQPSAGLTGEGQSSADTFFQPGQSFGTQQPSTDSQPSTYFGSPQASESQSAESAFTPGQSFGTQQPVAAAQPGTDAQPSTFFGSPQVPEGAPNAESAFTPGQSFGIQQPGAGADSQASSYFGLSQASEGQSAESAFVTGQAFGTQQPDAGAQPSANSQLSPSFGLPQTSESQSTESAFAPGQSFGTQQRPTTESTDLPASYFLPDPPFTPDRPFTADSSFTLQPPSADPTPERPQEKTGPIKPVGTAPDSETTGPIRAVPSDGWTLPGG
ncbi:hypothetical protein [Lentzea sp. NPDC051838]|uniref:hypothetical protein n=1 Tax=Lentzea sp. NPDC051838 TaxID=3154849 RepID=UPI0034382FF6